VPVPAPTPGERVIDDTEKDKEAIETNSTNGNGTDTEHPNAVVPDGHNSGDDQYKNHTDAIAPTQVVEPPSDSGKTHVWQIIGVILIGVLVVLVSAYTFIKLRKRCARG
jgi:hypothetical protein